MEKLKVYDLTVNYLSNPCGIDTTPRFSFKISSEVRGDELKSFKIIVSKTEDFSEVVFEKTYSGKDGILVPYEGKALSPITKYYFKIEAESNSGKGESEVSYFVTGKLNERWEGKWITAMSVRREDSAFAAPYLRKEFDISGNVKSAYLTICGLGYFESYINGEKTGDDFLSPAFTRYDETDMYLVYDVKNLVVNGKNALGVIIGNGWYNCFAEDPWNTKAASWKHWPKVICELKIEYEDGTVQKVVSDPTWKAANNGPQHAGPIIFNGIRNGEHYDARLELGEWNTPGYDDSDWQPTKIMKSPGGLLRAMEMEPIRIRKTFTAVKMWKTVSGDYVFDIGQNQAGVARLTFRGKANTEYEIRYSDVLGEDNEIDQAPIGGFVRSHGFQTDKYIKNSDDVEVWNARFCYHGYQYVQISGIDYEPELSDVVALTLCTDVKDIGHFSCSDELLNKVQHMCRWSTISNMHSVPTDCPHREKNGWTGDVSLSCEQMLTNFGTRAFLSKWDDDMLTAQRPAGQIPCVVPSTGWGYYGLMGPDWSSALINVPYNIYIYNADKDILAKNYEAIKKNCDFMESMTTDYTLDYGTGDWCPPFEGPAISKNMGNYKCPTRVSDTGFFYNAAMTVVKIAEILGYGEDAKYYKDLASKIRETFRNLFYDKENNMVTGDCQTATAVMLYFNLCTEEERPGLINTLISQIERNDWHLDFGVLGNKFVMHTLGASGNGNIGQRMLSQRTFPGCQRWVDLGATTLWECWNGGGSHNHHMFSDISSFMYKYIAGISPDEKNPGFKHIILRPSVDCGIESAKGSHDSMFGEIECYWSNRDGKLNVNLTIPFGTTASLYLPKKYIETISENGTKLVSNTQYETNDKEVIFTLTSGVYNLEA